MPQDGTNQWGPVTVMCNNLKTEMEYGKLIIQIQYVSFENILFNPPSIPSDQEPNLLSIRFLGVNLAVATFQPDYH